MEIKVGDVCIIKAEHDFPERTVMILDTNMYSRKPNEKLSKRFIKFFVLVPQCTEEDDEIWSCPITLVSKNLGPINNFINI